MGVLQEGQTKHSFAKQVVHPAQKQTKKKASGMTVRFPKENAKSFVYQVPISPKSKWAVYFE